MRWSGATGAIARCKRVSTGCGRKRRSVPAWPWICGVKPKPKAVNKPSPHSIVHGLDKPGVFTTVSNCGGFMCQMTVTFPAPMVVADSWFSDSKLMRYVAKAHQGTLLVQGKSSYTFTLEDGRKVKGADLVKTDNWSWQ